MENRLVNPHDCQYVQSRVALDVFAVAEYEDMMERGIVFEPCKGILCDDGAIIIYDGNHRAEAAKGNGAMIEVELTPGTAQDADWQASGANTKHGIRRTVSDIEKSVKAALRHPNAQGASDREIARHCGCDHKTVGKYRKDLETSGERPQMPVKTVTRNGTEYQMTIPMPKEPEPESTRNPSPMVFDEHMPTAPKTPSRSAPKNEKASVEQITRRIQDWLFTEQEIHAQVSPLIKCLDCGEEIPRPEDRDALHLCLECQEARRREQERLIEVHQRQGLIPTPELEPEPETPNEIMFICDFCGKMFPESHVYNVFQRKDTAKIIKASICAKCVMIAARAITRYEDIAKPYSCPDCGYKFQAVAVKFYADDDTSRPDVP